MWSTDHARASIAPVPAPARARALAVVALWHRGGDAPGRHDRARDPTPVGRTTREADHGHGPDQGIIYFC